MGDIWVEQPDSRRLRKSKDGKGQWILHFQADKGDGEAKAISEGYVFGLVATIDGREWTLDDREVQEGTAFDDVNLYFVSPEGRSTRASYRDGKARRDGDEVWSLRGSLGRSVPAKDALAYSGTTFDTSWGVAEDMSIEQPVQELIWKKWFSKDTLGSRVQTLPTSKTAALDMAKTYQPDQTGNSFETSGPRLMHTLAGDRNWLCVSVDVDEDGDLVLRTAVFMFKLGGWTSTVYG